MPAPSQARASASPCKTGAFVTGAAVGCSALESWSWGVAPKGLTNRTVHSCSTHKGTCSMQCLRGQRCTQQHQNAQRLSGTFQAVQRVLCACPCHSPPHCSQTAIRPAWAGQQHERQPRLSSKATAHACPLASSTAARKPAEAAGASCRTRSAIWRAPAPRKAPLAAQCRRSSLQYASCRKASALQAWCCR